MKKTVLVFNKFYLPGYKAGGPILSLANLISALGDDYCFKVLTTDRDSGDVTQYPGIETCRWTKAGNADVYYVPFKDFNFSRMVGLIREVSPDVIYLNSFFNFKFTILPLLAWFMGLTGKPLLVLAPRGEFSDGALSIKPLRKGLYVALFKLFRLGRDVIWHASSQYEALDIQNAVSADTSRIKVAPVLPRALLKEAQGSPRGRSTPLRIVFLSRISPMKNLEYAIGVLGKVRAPVAFTVYGPIADKDYWGRCLKLARELPSNIEFDYGGLVDSARVVEFLGRHDLLLFPTRGENYGHVIAEALIAGLPLLISDQTPWRGLSDLGIGRDLSLDDEAQFVEYVEYLAVMSDDQYRELRSKVSEGAALLLDLKEKVEASRRIFSGV